MYHGVSVAADEPEPVGGEELVLEVRRAGRRRGCAWLAWARIAAQRVARCALDVDDERDLLVGRAELAEREVGVAAAVARMCSAQRAIDERARHHR